MTVMSLPRNTLNRLNIIAAGYDLWAYSIALSLTMGHLALIVTSYWTPGPGDGSWWGQYRGELDNTAS